MVIWVDCVPLVEKLEIWHILPILVSWYQLLRTTCLESGIWIVNERRYVAAVLASVFVHVCVWCYFYLCSRQSGAGTIHARSVASPFSGTSRRCGRRKWLVWGRWVVSMAMAHVVAMAMSVAFFLQHHCRKCGRAVCAACSDHTSTYPKMGFEKPVRMCQDCHSSLTTDEWVSLINLGIAGLLLNC